MESRKTMEDSIPPLDVGDDIVSGPREYHASEVEDSEDDGMMDDISDVDAQSLLEPALSRAATHLASPQTPAAEKAAAMDNLDGFFVDSDGEITPPASLGFTHSSTIPNLVEANSNDDQAPSKGGVLPLGKKPSPSQQDQGFPSSWSSGSKPLIEGSQGRSALKEALSSVRPRSSSWGSDLKKFLPSLPKSGNFLNSNSLFSANTDQKLRNWGDSKFGSSDSSSTQISAPADSSILPEKTGDDSAAAQVPAVRRITSEESLLYHTLSRASSLGDDARFVDQHEQVNSRGKALRDSFQDRSSFKLPALPSLPNMPTLPALPNIPSKLYPYYSGIFSALSFSPANSGELLSGFKINAEPTEGIITGGTKKKHPVSPSDATAQQSEDAATGPQATKESINDLDGANTSYLDLAMEDLHGDVVILGGYRGSILRSTKTKQQVWAPIKIGLNIRKVNLEVGLNHEDEEKMPGTIYPSGMLKNVGPIDISKRLFKKLRSCENAKNGSLRVWDYGYDWRLSPDLLSKQLVKFLQRLPSNRGSHKDGALVIAHSLGGLITRHAVNRSPELFSGVIYAGVPHSCVNILGPIRNGDVVLLSSRILTAQVNFTIRTTFALLPLDGFCFIDKNGKDEYKIDFFNLDDWIEYRLSPCTDPPLPPKRLPTGSLSNILNGNFTSLSLPRKMSLSSSPKKSSSSDMQEPPNGSSTSLGTKVDNVAHELDVPDRTLAPQMGNLTNPVNRGQTTNSSVSTAVTIPRDQALDYLRRVLAETKLFKEELRYDSNIGDAGRYPPAAVIYGKNTPTVYGARVDGRDGIACADSYDDLAFASGDGVVLAKEAMVPEGYSCVKGGCISSSRGHVTLLGDLNAVGKTILAVRKGRMKGIGVASV